MPRAKFRVVVHRERPDGGTYCGKSPPLPWDNRADRLRLYSDRPECEDKAPPPREVKTPGDMLVAIWLEVVPRT